MKKDSENNDTPGIDNSTRRKLVSTIAAAGGVTAASKWRKPIVDSVVLPAHAQSSLINSGSFGGTGTISTPG